MSKEKPKMLYICRKQFGYSVDNYYHCKYLASDFIITYFSPDIGLEKIEIQGVKSIYLRFKQNRYVNNLFFYLLAIFYIKNLKPDIILLNRSNFFFLFKIFYPKKKFIYDIRSGIVSPSSSKRFVNTRLLKMDLLFYKNVTVISHSLAQRLQLKKYHVLPLGADKFRLSPKEFSVYRLVYAGVFENRRIHETIEGYGLFLQEIKPEDNWEYHLYGFGSPESIERINTAISQYSLEGKVFLHGRYKPLELSEILDKHNIGVSYIPVTPYFDVQPPTKTFEYLLAGMPVIATKTYENKLVIKDYNGVIISDNPTGFKKGLTQIMEDIKKGKYDSNRIVSFSQKYTWEYIVKNNFLQYIIEVLSSG